jgi:hypothetical protein
MRYLISVTLIITGIIHLLPLAGVVGADKLSVLYGITIGDPNLVILMRHRAVLFGLLGIFFIYAALRPKYQALAFIAGIISTISFLWLAWSADSYNPQINRIVVADIVALASLCIGIVAYRFSNKFPRA